MGMIRQLAGQVRVQLTGADPGRTLSVINEAGISVAEVSAEDEFTVRFAILRRDYRALSAIARRRGDSIRLEREGLYWDLKGLLRRPVFLAGIGLYLALALWVPSRVFFVEVEGNGTIPANVILETAEACGIRFGASRREVRSEQVKNALLEAMPELSWAGVNTYGCRAVITVKPGEPEVKREDPPAVSSIVAARDGIVLSADVTAGSGRCAPGQAVKAGEVLISGYTDCGLCVTATRAGGEVMALTNRSFSAVTPAKCLKKGERKTAKVQYSLIVGKKRIIFYNNSGISDAGCGRMVTEYHLTLPGGFRLPVTLQKQTVTASELTETETERASVRALLTAFARRCLGEEMIAGTVTEAVETVTARNGMWRLTGEYACTEMLGRERAEGNGEYHETN